MQMIKFPIFLVCFNYSKHFIRYFLTKLLKLDPDPQKMREDPHPWWIRSSENSWLTDLLLVPPAVAPEPGQHEVIALLRQELGPVPDTRTQAFIFVHYCTVYKVVFRIRIYFIRIRPKIWTWIQTSLFLILPE